MWKVDTGSESGVTTAAWQQVVLWPVAELAAKTLLFKNTHASASLYYRFCAFTGANIGVEVAPETLLEAGAVAEFHCRAQWARLVLEVKNGSGAATWLAEYQGQGA